MSIADLKHFFPSLDSSNCQITSPRDTKYNCIGWAAGNNNRWWEPDPQYQYFWPEGIPREYSFGAYKKMFEGLGYITCEKEELEKGFEKVAIYGIDDEPMHAARQLSNGQWTSKLGQAEDIQHSLGALIGSSYGKVKIIMKKAIS